MSILAFRSKNQPILLLLSVCEGGSVQAAVQAGGKTEKGFRPSAGLHCRPDGEILRPSQQVTCSQQAS